MWVNALWRKGLRGLTIKEKRTGFYRLSSALTLGISVFEGYFTPIARPLLTFYINWTTASNPHEHWVITGFACSLSDALSCLFTITLFSSDFHRFFCVPKFELPPRIVLLLKVGQYCLGPSMIIESDTRDYKNITSVLEGCWQKGIRGNP